MRDVEVAGFERLDDCLEQFLALGGQLMVCAPCSEYYCSFDRDLVASTLIPGAHDCR
jgi:hypothetical protein